MWSTEGKYRTLEFGFDGIRALGSPSSLRSSTQKDADTKEGRAAAANGICDYCSSPAVFSWWYLRASTRKMTQSGSGVLSRGLQYRRDRQGLGSSQEQVESPEQWSLSTSAWDSHLGFVIRSRSGQVRKGVLHTDDMMTNEGSHARRIVLVAPLRPTSTSLFALPVILVDVYGPAGITSTSTNLRIR